MSQRPVGSGAKRRATRKADAAADTPRRQRRFSARRKAAAVMRLVSGETLEELSRELGVAAHELSRWREQYEVGGRAALKGRAADAGDVEVKRLKEKIGELTMDNELLYERIHAMEAGSPFAGMRPKR